MAVKSIGWVIALVSFAIPYGLGETAKALPGDPDYFCFASDYSRVVNLNNLCAQNPPLPPQPQPSPQTITITTPKKTVPSGSTSSKPKKSSKGVVIVDRAARLKMEFSNLKYQDNMLSGRARNKEREPMTMAALLYEVQSSKDKVNWKTTYEGYICLVDDSLSRGQTTEFRGFASSGNKVVITSVANNYSRCRP